MMHPDFVINVGDTIQGGKERPPAEIERQWSDLRPLWERYSHYPLYFTPGNHDVFNDTSAALYARESKRPLFYSFNYQDAHFTVLDNARGDALNDEQLTFLEKDLRKHKDKRPKFIFFHKPFWIARWKKPDGEFALHQIAKRYGVEHIISGHGHQFVRMVRDGIAYMEVGSSGGTMGGAPSQPARGAPLYTCPMHPEVVRDGPGKCPKCGMDLVPKKGAASPPGKAAAGATASMCGCPFESFFPKNQSAMNEPTAPES